MGITQAKLAPIVRQAEHGAPKDTLKRAASLPLPDASIKRRANALEPEDTTDQTHDELSSSSKDNKSCETMRDSLDEDEKFLELPHLFDLVGIVAQKYGMDDELLHRNYRGQDMIPSFHSE
jgi:hypothetical protein